MKIIRCPSDLFVTCTLVRSESLVFPGTTALASGHCLYGYTYIHFEVYLRKQKLFGNFQCSVRKKQADLLSWTKCRGRAGELMVLKGLMWGAVAKEEHQPKGTAH